MVNDKVLSLFCDNPPANWDDNDNRDIKGGPLYSAKEVNALLADSESIRLSTQKCSRDVQNLELDNEELALLIRKAVSGGRYRRSVWCRISNKAIAACDDYVVIEKTWVEAVAKEMECEIYLKFAINQNGKLLLMVSCHPST